ncbi:klaroid isoform a-related [Anaeramoeba ignava]|uniref:Klaroid isoform a-related n=1 Tax=Anaeramoeba ignava TaxID=1746090 RepID=A0A9Q0LU24_ANAIG|nr:klaroid isoform a-related [Anaeramoeba ignava]
MKKVTSPQYLFPSLILNTSIAIIGYQFSPTIRLPFNIFYVGQFLNKHTDKFIQDYLQCQLDYHPDLETVILPATRQMKTITMKEIGSTVSKLSSDYSNINEMLIFQNNTIKNELLHNYQADLVKNVFHQPKVEQFINSIIEYLYVYKNISKLWSQYSELESTRLLLKNLNPDSQLLNEEQRNEQLRLALEEVEKKIQENLAKEKRMILEPKKKMQELQKRVDGLSSLANQMKVLGDGVKQFKQMIDAFIEQITKELGELSISGQKVSVYDFQNQIQSKFEAYQAIITRQNEDLEKLTKEWEKLNGELKADLNLMEQVVIAVSDLFKILSPDELEDLRKFHETLQERFNILKDQLPPLIELNQEATDFFSQVIKELKNGETEKEKLSKAFERAQNLQSKVKGMVSLSQEQENLYNQAQQSAKNLKEVLKNFETTVQKQIGDLETRIENIMKGPSLEVLNTKIGDLSQKIQKMNELMKSQPNHPDLADNLQQLEKEYLDLSRNLDKYFEDDIKLIADNIQDVFEQKEKEQKEYMDNLRKELMDLIDDHFKVVPENLENWINQNPQEFEELIRSIWQDKNNDKLDKWARDKLSSQDQTLSESLEDIENRIFKEVLRQYREGPIGKTNFANEKLGAKIDQKRSKFTKFGSNEVATILQANNEPGDCFSFNGNEAEIAIQLPTKLALTHVSLRHIPFSFVSDHSTAPRAFNVYTLDKTSNEKDAKVNLGSFEFQFDNDSFPSVQAWDLNPKITTDKIFIQFISNYGNKDYTCVYNVGVFGDLIDPVQSQSDPEILM